VHDADDETGLAQRIIQLDGRIEFQRDGDGPAKPSSSTSTLRRCVHRPEPPVCAQSARSVTIRPATSWISGEVIEPSSETGAGSGLP
jgi:hypothetical protein